VVVCVENSGYGAALERRKLYALLPDLEAETRGLQRVIDESGEDYLYPAGMFYKVELPVAVRQAVFRAV
jgi:sulfur transfer complex TusBCD TusB component (DsrH family)